MLMIATDDNLNALALVLFLISQKRIPMWRDAFHEVKRRKKLRPLRDFMRKPSDYDHFRGLDRATKIHQLVELGLVLKLAMYPLFYRREGDVDEGEGETVGEGTEAKAKADRLLEQQNNAFPPSARTRKSE